MSDACEVPLVEKLRSVPIEYRTAVAIQWSVDGHETGHRFIPVGYMMHEAANEIEVLRRKVEELSRCSITHDEWYAKCNELAAVTKELEVARNEVALMIQADYFRNDIATKQLAAMTKERDAWESDFKRATANCQAQTIRLAVAQADNTRLRGALEAYRGQLDQYGKHSSVEALATPFGDTALQEMLKDSQASILIVESARLEDECDDLGLLASAAAIRNLK